MKEEITEAIASFWKKKGLLEIFPDVFIFGSLINRDGQHFIPAGTMGSDIDLLIVFDPSLDNAISRKEAVETLSKTKMEIEHILAGILNRTDLILSILAATDYEVYHCIHKGHDPKIFTMNIFHDVLRNREIDGGLSDFIDFDFHLENIEQFGVLRSCQSFRNRFLAIDLLGNSDLDNFDGPGEVPKELMRSFALLNYVDKISSDQDDAPTKMEEVRLISGYRTDLQRGFEFLRSTLESLSNSDQRYLAIKEKVSSRSFYRSKSEPLLPVDQLILFEVACDEARKRIRKSVREAIDGL